MKILFSSALLLIACGISALEIPLKNPEFKIVDGIIPH